MLRCAQSASAVWKTPVQPKQGWKRIKSKSCRLNSAVFSSAQEDAPASNLDVALKRSCIKQIICSHERFETSRLQRYSCLGHSMAQRIHIRLYTFTTTSAKHWKILEDPVRLQAIQLRQLWESLIRNGQCLDSAP